MEDEIFGAEGEGTLHFPTQGLDGVGPHRSGLAAEIDQVAGVNDQRRAGVKGAQLLHAVTVLRRKDASSPHAGAGREDLEGVGADGAGALGGTEDSARCGQMNAYAAG